MRYFAMIEGVQCGPYDLSELHDAGVTPDTYVWCKEMDDWQPAAEVADICRYWRQRLSGSLPASAKAEPGETPEDASDETGGSGRFNRFGMSGVSELPKPETLFEPENLHTPPRTMLVPAVLVTLACFPVTGFVAIYYAVLTRRCWKAAEHAAAGAKDVPPGFDIEEMRRSAYDASRNARMWTGITLFLGFILWGFVLNRCF